ncbi:hypothetical protein GIB67_005056 [Kingdonia uniflora]|uniref:Uncharacterized protein n=1 Tax=Kingdonia uniflora TaxID=39325 RepID=A0A7J7PBA3_9MAGN|nr:hypothetical protein GIB67_005056 [Kingdonia uniflora]
MIKLSSYQAVNVEDLLRVDYTIDDVILFLPSSRVLNPVNNTAKVYHDLAKKVIWHITTEVGAAIVCEGVVEELAEGHGDIGTKELMHMSEEETKEYVARSMWYLLYHPLVHEK